MLLSSDTDNQNFTFFSSFSLNLFFTSVLGDGGDTNTINLDKYFYFPENNSDFSANNFKIALPNPPPQQTPTVQQTAQSSWVDYSAVQSSNNGLSSNVPLELPPLTEIKQEKVEDDYEPVRDVPVWRTAKSTSKITMYPSKDSKTHTKRRFQQIQPKPPALTPAVMPPLTQITAQKPTPKLVAVAVKKIVPIQPKPTSELPKLTQIHPKQSMQVSTPQSKLVIKKVSHISMNTRRHSTGNSSKIVPTKELLESLKQENIIYQDNEDKPWYCKTCGRNYKWRNSLKQHIKNECGTDTAAFVFPEMFFSWHNVFPLQEFRQNIIAFANAATRLTFIPTSNDIWIQNFANQEDQNMTTKILKHISSQSSVVKIEKFQALRISF